MTIFAIFGGGYTRGLELGLPDVGGDAVVVEAQQKPLYS